jgi:hypothetical protein
LTLHVNSRGQSRKDLDTVRTWAIVVGPDTLPLINLPEVVIAAKMPARFRARMEEWSRLRSAVYTTYPYAREASQIFRAVNAKLATISDKKQKKIYLASEEVQLKKEFAPKLENLTIYQGKILMKLISRETGSNCYDIIKELRGGFSARLWQTVAFFFDSNLKTDYDTQQDNDIEIIVREIEQNNSYQNYN